MKQRREKFRGEMVNKILLLFLEYCYNTILTLELYCSSIAKKFAIVVFTIFWCKAFWGLKCQIVFRFDISILQCWCSKQRIYALLWETASPTRFMMLGQTHVKGWSRVITSQNGSLTDYIFPLRLGVLQWIRHLFNYWKNKKTIIERFLILLIWNWIYINHRKITWLWS